MQPTSKGLQCKDIDDALFLKAVENAAWARDRPYAVLWDVRYYVSMVMWKVFVADIEKIMGPLGFEAEVMDPANNSANLISEKLIRNKARKLIRRGLLFGCYCGCRGEWRVNPEMGVVVGRRSDGSTYSHVYKTPIGVRNEVKVASLDASLIYRAGKQGGGKD